MARAGGAGARVLPRTRIRLHADQAPVGLASGRGSDRARDRGSGSGARSRVGSEGRSRVTTFPRKLPRRLDHAVGEQPPATASRVHGSGTSRRSRFRTRSRGLPQTRFSDRALPSSHALPSKRRLHAPLGNQGDDGRSGPIRSGRKRARSPSPALTPPPPLPAPPASRRGRGPRRPAVPALRPGSPPTGSCVCPREPARPRSGRPVRRRR